MATSMGKMRSVGPCSSPLKKKGTQRGRSVISAASRSLTDPYRILRIQPGASETEVRKAFRQLALQYHPDVCKGNNCGVQFHQINEAYDMREDDVILKYTPGEVDIIFECGEIVMSSLRASEDEEEQWRSQERFHVDVDEPMRGMCDSDWDLWEEWMGWEGAGIRDYTSHINPYI